MQRVGAKSIVKGYTAWAGFSSEEPYQFSLWRLIPTEDDDNNGFAITQIGSTQDFNGGSNCENVSSFDPHFYNVNESSLSVNIAKGNWIFAALRYTDGSGNKYAYGGYAVELEADL